MNTSSPCEVPLTPFTYYSGTVVCYTAGCIRENLITTIDSFYSNNDVPYVVCGKCSQFETILAATALDPQPIVS